jgi:hypothetical protein
MSDEERFEYMGCLISVDEDFYYSTSGGSGG